MIQTELSSLISLIDATKWGLLISFAGGSLLAILIYLARPLLLRMRRNEVNRLIISETQSLSTLAWGSLAVGAIVGSYFILHVQLPDHQRCDGVSAIAILAILLMLVFIFSNAMMNRLQMKRLAEQLIELRRTLPASIA